MQPKSTWHSNLVWRNFEKGTCGFLCSWKPYSSEKFWTCLYCSRQKQSKKTTEIGICWLSHAGTIQQEMKILQTYKLDCFCFVIQRCTHGDKRLCTIKIVFGNSIVSFLTFKWKKIGKQLDNDNLSYFIEHEVHLYGDEKLKQKTSKFFNISSTTPRKQASQISRCLHERFFNIWKSVAIHFFLFMTFFCRRNSLKYFLVEVSRSLKNALSSYETIISSAVSTSSILFEFFRFSKSDTFFSKTVT